MFEIDPAFAPGSQALGELAFSHARLQTDARWPWIVLIPRVEGARELEDLTVDQRARLIEEVVAAGAAVRAVGAAVEVAVEKLNVGALGNVTPQLHVHVVGRRKGDPAWPGPVWGVGTAEAYESERLAAALAAARASLRLP
jgi:diadenosine tetraphosphate (Ap4A) HIT family hydrolase